MPPTCYLRALDNLLSICSTMYTYDILILPRILQCKYVYVLAHVFAFRAVFCIFWTAVRGVSFIPRSITDGNPNNPPNLSMNMII